ncbi:HAMP domain-containing sensor histidine kinase [Planotetraspora phitsanulokensis]|uniref:histidine kinase n=1 Tax=Planotetraspora phitsanulokensis TaxID=575192 RepID=A0A8J3UEY0_9ACTN|nr:HAMP domain-containing sensor histidine kinase [Planotetraspora phitsanulokensis]GII43241.1 two-component sensor histidine kinase [Planotetraspora phitsanulokensis]
MSAPQQWSITTRITLFTGVVAALLSALLATVLMIALSRIATDFLTDELAANAGRVAVAVERDQISYPLSYHQSRNMQVVDTEGKVVAATDRLRGKPRMARFTPDKTTATSIVCGGVFPAEECNIVVAKAAQRDGEKWIVYSASPVLPAWVDPRLAALVGGSAVMLAAAVTYLGHRVADASLRPVRAIQGELEEINATCPDRRVPVPNSDDEIHDLAESVNHTLSRLEAALLQQRQFVSDASHDLRSPIAAMQAEVEDALMAPQETTVPKLGVTLLSDLKRLQAIVHDLLTIARLDSAMPGAREPVDLSDLVGTELRARRHTKVIETVLQPGVFVVGDRSRLVRVFTNLVDNAQRHAESTIIVTVRREPESGDQRFPVGVAVLEVVDDGPGIDPDKRELVFQRFIRLDAARSKDAGGAGLGLAIARQIAESGGGTLRIEDSTRGARFVLRLPAVPAADDAVEPAARDSLNWRD